MISTWILAFGICLLIMLKLFFNNKETHHVPPEKAIEKALNDFGKSLSALASVARHASDSLRDLEDAFAKAKSINPEL